LSSWLVLALASSLFLGGYEVSRKASLVNNSPLLVLLSASVGGWCSLALALLVLGDVASLSDLGFQVHTLSASQHWKVFLKAALVSLSWVLAYSSVKHLPLTLAGPLRSLSPALTVLGAFLLFDEAPSVRQWVGIAVIFTGYLAFAQVGRLEGIAFSTNRWVWLLLLGTAVGAMSGLYDKHLLQAQKFHPTTMQFWFVTYAALLQAALVAVLWYPRRAQESQFRFTWTAPLAGALLVLADQFYFRALGQADALVSVVSLVRRSSVLVSFGLGSWLFKERFLRNKSAALALVVVGLLILVSG
jgi:bacterial/archaeal transporter family protein